MKEITIAIGLFLALMFGIASCAESDDTLNGSFPYDEGDVAAMIKVYQGMNIEELPERFHWDLSNPARWPDWIVRWEDDSVLRKRFVVYLNLNIIGVANLKGSPYDYGSAMWTEPLDAIAHPAIGKLSHLRYLEIVDHYTCVMPLPGLYECPLETIDIDYFRARASMEGSMDWVDNLSDLKYLSVTFTHLSGNLPSLKKFNNLNSLFLHYNSFVGEIPSNYISLDVPRRNRKEGYGIDLENNAGYLTYPWMSLLDVDDWSGFPYATCIKGEVPYEVYTDPRWDLYNMNRVINISQVGLRKAPPPGL